MCERCRCKRRKTFRSWLKETDIFDQSNLEKCILGVLALFLSIIFVGFAHH